MVDMVVTKMFGPPPNDIIDSSTTRPFPPPTITPLPDTFATSVVFLKLAIGVIGNRVTLAVNMGVVIAMGVVILPEKQRKGSVPMTAPSTYFSPSPMVLPLPLPSSTT